MARHWILKSDPDVYGFPDLLRDRRTAWDGVSNSLALKHLREMRRGDPVLVYHSGKEKALVGLARVASDPYPDPKDRGGKLVVVDLEAGEPLARPVPLGRIKDDAALAALALVRMPRLSVVPVEPAQWRRLLDLAGGR